MPEPITLAQVKLYLGLFHNDKDAALTDMIPQAREWVERHTGLYLMRRQRTDPPRYPDNGKIRLFYGPLVSVDAVSYNDGTGNVVYAPRAFVPSTTLVSADCGWPSTRYGLNITYTAGFADGTVDRLLIGAMLALIEGEFSEGYAYPDRSIESAERCCNDLRLRRV